MMRRGILKHNIHFKKTCWAFCLYAFCFHQDPCVCLVCTQLAVVCITRSRHNRGKVPDDLRELEAENPTRVIGSSSLWIKMKTSALGGNTQTHTHTLLTRSCRVCRRMVPSRAWIHFSRSSASRAEGDRQSRTRPVREEPHTHTH